MSSLNERLKAWRLAKGLSQEAAAAALGVPMGTYQKYELGTRGPRVDSMEAFVRAGINANWLLTGEGPMRLADLADATRGPDTFDRERMAAAIEALEEVLTEAKRTMAPARKAQVLLAAYDLLEEPSATREKVVQLLRFAA